MLKFLQNKFHEIVESYISIVVDPKPSLPTFKRYLPKMERWGIVGFGSVQIQHQGKAQGITAEECPWSLPMRRRMEARCCGWKAKRNGLKVLSELKSLAALASGSWTQRLFELKKMYMSQGRGREVEEKTAPLVG